MGCDTGRVTNVLGECSSKVIVIIKSLIALSYLSIPGAFFISSYLLHAFRSTSPQLIECQTAEHEGLNAPVRISMSVETSEMSADFGTHQSFNSC